MTSKNAPVDFASPPSVPDENLDADHDSAPLCFRTIDNLIGIGSPRMYTPRELEVDELHMVSADEPAYFVEAEHHQSWC